MKLTVVTSGRSFNDIDALACAVAYAELLALEGKRAEAVLPAPLNHSVTEAVKSWGLHFKTMPSDEDFFSVLVDTSHGESFSEFVTEDSIAEIYDHHYGDQEYWDEKLKEHSHIELIGACATLIWEEFKKRGFAEKITIASANLLYTAILSNTLNFGAQITDQRDITAYEELKRYTQLPADWTESYFADQEKTVYADIRQSMLGDTKVLKIPTFPFPIVVGQMELWDSKQCLMDHMPEIRATLEGFKEQHWLLSLPSISEKRNYLYTEDAETQQIFSDIIGASWNGNVGTTEKLWLRKEIRKKLWEYIK